MSLALFLVCGCFATFSLNTEKCPRSRQGQQLSSQNHSRLIFSRGFHPEWSPQPKKDKRNALVQALFTQMHILFSQKHFMRELLFTNQLKISTLIPQYLWAFPFFTVRLFLVEKNKNRQRATKRRGVHMRQVINKLRKAGKQVKHTRVEQAVKTSWINKSNV